MEHPPYDVAPSGDTLGLRHVREALADIEYPIRTTELRDIAGRWRIPITGAEFRPLGELLDGVPERTFRSAEAVASAIAKEHPELKESFARSRRRK